MTINEKLTKIQTEFKSKKSRFNSFGKYYFRSAEDILEATKPFLKELGVTVRINEELISYPEMGGEVFSPVLQCTATLYDGENSLSATAIVGVDLNQKGMQTAQQFGAASSYGKKYALGNLFLIDDTQDADESNDHGKKSNVVNKIKQAAKPSITTGQMKKAKEYIEAGGDIAAIESKYKLTDEQRKNLTEVKK